MTATNEKTRLNDTNVDKEKSTFMWRTHIIFTLFGVGIVFSLSLFFSTPNSSGIITPGHSTNLVRARNNELSLLGNKDVIGAPVNRLDFGIYGYSPNIVLTLSNTNHNQYDVSTGESLVDYNTLGDQIIVLASRHKTHAVATSFCQKSAINNISTRITHTGPGRDYPGELNFWVQFDTLSFDVTNPHNNKKSVWTISNFVIGQGSGGGRNNWWYGAPSCTEGHGTLLVCETTIAGHYLVLSNDSNIDGVYVYCQVGINSKNDIRCLNA